MLKKFAGTYYYTYFYRYSVEEFCAADILG